jgi:hypothetical protein
MVNAVVPGLGLALLESGRPNSVSGTYGRHSPSRNTRRVLADAQMLLLSCVDH